MGVFATADGGGIKIQADNSGTTSDGGVRSTPNIGIHLSGETAFLAKSGDIRLSNVNAKQFALKISYGSPWFGSKAGSLVPTSHADIYIESNISDLSPTPMIATNGKFTYTPVATYDNDNVNGYEFTIWAPSLFPINQNNTVLTGLTIGRPDMTKGLVTIDAPMRVNGPVSLYAYGLLKVEENIDTSGANGDIQLVSRNDAITLSGNIIGAGKVSLDSPTSVINSDYGQLNGDFTLSAGVLQVKSTNFDPSQLTVQTGATMQLDGVSLDVDSIAGQGNIALGSNTLTIGQDYPSSVFGGVISGLGGLTKLGSGTLTLEADNTYTGATNINAGVLVVSSDSPVQSTSGYLGTGALRIEPISDSFSGNFSNSGWNFSSTLRALTIGKSSNTANIIIDDSLSSAGPVTVFGGDITLNESVTAGAGSNITIAASDSFKNNVGAAGLNVSGAGHWYVYTANGGSSANTYNGLDSLNQAVWGESFTTLTPDNVGTKYAGNRYIFAADPATRVIITTSDLSKEYGTLLDLNDSSSGGYQKPYTFTSEFTGQTVVGAYLAGGVSSLNSLSDAFSVMPVFAAANSMAGSDVSSQNITITDGVANANFSITYQYGQDYGQLTVTPKTLSVSGITAADKTYDGTTRAIVDASGVTFTGLIENDDLTIDSVTGLFADKNAGDNKSVTLTSTYSGSDFGNYIITNQATATADISAKDLSVNGITAADKTYDGTTRAIVDASGVTFTGLIENDDLTIDSVTGLFADKNVGDNKSVTLTSTYSGSDFGNYTITNQATATADISAKALSVSGITAANKTYDGTTRAIVDASGVTFTGLIANDDLTLDSVTGIFADKNVGDNKSVTLTSTYSGSDFGNYTITNQATATADISAKDLSVNGITAADKTYDGTTRAIVDASGVTFTRLIANDDLTLDSVTGIFADKNVGDNKSVTLTSTYSGSDFGNYTITNQATATADISAKALSVSGITAANKTYDGTTRAIVDASGVTFTGLIENDDLTIDSVTGLFADKNAGDNKSVTLTSTYSGSDFGNYTITNQATATADISAKDLSVNGITAADKTYDGTTRAIVDASGVTFTGLIENDDLTIDSVTGLFADKNVGDNKSVTLTSTYTGSDIGNYTITHQALAYANITSAETTVGDASTDANAAALEAARVAAEEAVAAAKAAAADAARAAATAAAAAVEAAKTAATAAAKAAAAIAGKGANLNGISKPTIDFPSNKISEPKLDANGVSTRNLDTGNVKESSPNPRLQNNSSARNAPSSETNTQEVQVSDSITEDALTGANVVSESIVDINGGSQRNLDAEKVGEPSSNESLSINSSAQGAQTSDSNTEELKISESSTNEALVGDSSTEETLVSDVAETSEGETKDEETTANTTENTNISQALISFLPSEPLGRVTVEAGENFYFETPAATFTHVNPSEQLTYSAAMVDGSPLPSWVTFDANTQTFSGVTPKGVQQVLDVVIKAVDTNSQEMQSKLQVDIK